MAPLVVALRRLLEKKVVEARDAAEAAAVAALKALAVDRSEPFPSMAEEQRQLRRLLRARARQLGSFAEPLDASEGFTLLASEIAYEQWHRMLFARFLAEDGLLMHPEHGVPVTLDECAELAPAAGEPDEWMLAARYASQMLPGIFRTNDPTLLVRFAPEGRQALERILAELPPEVFTSDDSLGWVYQFWQSKKKKEVNASERKIGGADLAPVTQLFTEHYMVAFLLENSLGAWWAGKHPRSPLLAEWEYLRFAEDGTPAAGIFEGWPATAAEVTMMDPCCGSGHFLVAAFEMLRKMREEEEGLSPKDAADAVLRDNLFGLELDGRCVQIAVFALALAAWKIDGYRELPPMNIACSGVPARGKVEEWRRLAQGDSRLADALERLYYLFKDADTLGSLIDPRRAAEADTLLGVEYEEVAPLLHEALSRYGGDDPAQQVFAQAAEDVATAAKLLAGRYTLVATNVPFAARGKLTEPLANELTRMGPGYCQNMSTAFMRRFETLALKGGSYQLVSPEDWRYTVAYEPVRQHLLTHHEVDLLVGLGFKSFGTQMWDFNVGLTTCTVSRADAKHVYYAIDASSGRSPAQKAVQLRELKLAKVSQSAALAQPELAVPLQPPSDTATLLGQYASCYQGISAGDRPRFGRKFWEVDVAGDPWRPWVGTVPSSVRFGGRSEAIRSDSLAEIAAIGGAVRGAQAWGRRGVLVTQMSGFPVTVYLGEFFDTNAAPVVPHRDEHLLPVLAFCEDARFERTVREVDKSLKVSNGSFERLPFDLEHWTKVAAETYPHGLPEPHSDDPTQWLFKGNVAGSESSLHVAVARLLGYSWPEQEPDELDRYCDTDGIVCLPPVGGERPAADRLLELLAAAYGSDWSQSVLQKLLAPEDASNLETWLREKFFASHCKLFGNRPFIWHIWDGRKDGFSALVNYHKLDRKLLERLIYTTLQSWVDWQKAEADRGTGGAEARLVAATELKRKLELILEGEPPYDTYVRWKPLSQQPVGWAPDVNDGVRLNVRPFVTAGVLRAKFNVKWEKDRGKNPDGSERLNDLHYTVAQKRDAQAGRSEG